ncbi:MAG TPA: BTAD domain-containing putative transcriptional regulator, partial [Chthonomonadaceae bacterium]|nr:BTAD domain-containing putative transcriptional regulator [Chthonomonadaceae bacterium]
MQPIDPEAAILPLSLRLLGPFQALLDGRPFSLRHSRKEQWLLALLTLRHNRDVERDWLAGTLWPESQKSRTLLRDTLSDLRQALGSQAGRLCSPTAHTLCLELTGADVDVLAFDAAIARGDQASLEEAVGLYRGPLLEGCTEEWALAERAAREQAYVQALERLAQQALSQANAASAVGYLQRVVLMDPLRESAQRALMQALAAAGDHAAAVLAYRDLRLLLRRELHADPDPETTALFQRIRQEARLRAHRSQLEMPSTISSASRQVSEESATQALASGTPETRPNNLPIPVTSFIGREAERETIQQLLSASRLVTLTGAGGCGKTRLALRVAADVLQSDTAYPDGVWLGELASLSDAALAPQRVSEALGLSDKPDQSFQETLLDHLKPRQLLLLLDNCEHLLSACAPLAGEILQHCAGVRILATSRQALGIQGESLYQVPSLRQPDPRDLPQDKKEIVAAVAGYDAVRLFVERASAQRSDFALTEQNARAVAEVCHRLDGIPLAIELAAARIGALTPAQIAARLDDRFGLLTGGSRTALPRQQTLKATLDWSYHLLSDPERILLRRLCVFSGGWTLEAAEQVCAGDGIASGEVLDLLSSLVDKSLVGFEVGMRGEGRYHLLETLRQYSRERLKERQEEKALRNRHLEFFLALAEDAERRHIEEDLAGWLETEHDNLRLALAWCKQEGEIEYRLRLSGSLWWFWWMRGYAGEGRATLTEALAHAEASGRTGVRAKALRAAGVLAGIQGDHEAA